MRKMLSVLLVVGMMVSLTACGGNSAGNTTAADTADGAETEQKKEVDAKPAVEGNAVKIQIGMR